MFTPRITWPDLPDHVRAEVETVMAGTVVSWVGQVGGFSPGTADRLVLEDGRRVFCKAVSEGMNAGSNLLYRREIVANRLLPDGLPVPTMVHGTELDGGWVVLLFDDLEGRHPHTPWQEDEFRAALTSIAEVASRVPVASEDLPSDLLADDMACFAAVAADPPPGLNPWVRDHLNDLVARAEQAAVAIGGTALCQLDARADNMVVDADGKVWLVDWPWACRGAAWLDGALLGMTALREGVGFDLEGIVDAHAAGHGGTPDDVTNLWVGELGYFIVAADRPAPPNLPTIRQYQARSRDALTAAVRRRLGGGPG